MAQESVAYVQGEPADPPSLAQRMERIERALRELDSEVDRAAERLAPILGPERPTGALDGTADRDRSELGAFLDRTAEGVRALTARLSYTLDRVDL